MVQKIGKQHSVVRAAVVHFKGTAGEHVVALMHAGLLCVFERHAKNRRPIKPGHMRLWILFGDFDSEESMAGSDVEHAHRAGFPFKHNRTKWTSQRSHHRPHGLGELDPDRIFRLNRAIAGKVGAAVAHDFTKMVERLKHRGI